YSPDTHRLHEFAVRSRVAHFWVELERYSDADRYLARRGRRQLRRSGRALTCREGPSGLPGRAQRRARRGDAVVPHRPDLSRAARRGSPPHRATRGRRCGKGRDDDGRRDEHLHSTNARGRARSASSSAPSRTPAGWRTRLHWTNVDSSSPGPRWTRSSTYRRSGPNSVASRTCSRPVGPASSPHDVRSGSVKRVATAAGEGSTAVRFAQEHLVREGS